ncbi:hypothetical protein CIB93_35835 [Streptomyces sp. WZ.A104]|uniref:hypothetical protein n=1 Tax=Streptomyces sp. WZ.A104 TaxID=2023771 RepID=UPI000BBCEEBF|nr:hypothetical protein [Streptomyces sp. WZ.A104]PCG81357.1 hypothetical protein CIB93_35835 [Streptomyces sp. WZ.A104]
MRTNDDQRQQAEDRIRAAMDRLLRGEIPPGGRCDIKTLATQAGVNRTGFYPKEGRPGPFQHLAEEFTRRRDLLQQAGTIPDPREAQITRLKEEITNLRRRLDERDTEVQELTDFRQQAISRLAAQHLEIESLRQQLSDGSHRQVTNLPRPRRTTTIGPC